MIQQFQQANLQPFQRKAIEHYQYNLSDIIGRGFSSNVYKGENDKTGETVAIKVVEQRSLQEQVQTMVLTNEIDTLKKLKSENILKLHDVYYTVNNTYIITEFCNQGDLGTYIKQNGALKEEPAIKVLKHVVNGLKELQKHGIAHRDLKPDNILLKDGVPKIADFGFAKSLEQITQNAGKEFNVGTPLYMSPETLTKNEYSDKTDIWALGVMFYELIFGQLPWTAVTEQELMHQIFNLQVTFPVQQPVSEESKNLITRCIKVDPTQRMSLNDIINHPLIRQKKEVAINRDRRVDSYQASPNFDSSSPSLKKPSSEKMVTRTIRIPGRSNYHQTANALSVLQFKGPDPQYSNTDQSKIELGGSQSTSNTQDYVKVWILKCERILQSYIDLCKSLRKFYPQLDTPQIFTSPQLLNKLRFITVKNIMIVITKLKEQLEDEQGKKNHLKLQSWKQFLETPQYQKIRILVTDLYFQYERLFLSVYDELSQNEAFLSELNYDKNIDSIFDKNFFQFPSFYIILADYLKSSIKELNHNLLMRFKPEQVPKECQNYLSTLDQLLSYYQMIKLLKKNLFDPYNFSEQSKLLTQVEVLTITNQLEFSQLRQKIKVITQ